MSNGLVTITIAGLVAGVVITITAPPVAAVLMVGWITCLAGRLPDPQEARGLNNGVRQQNRDFTTAVVSQYPLDEAIDWIRSNMEPEDVFEPETLLAWAKENAPAPRKCLQARLGELGRRERLHPSMNLQAAVKQIDTTLGKGYAKAQPKLWPPTWWRSADRDRQNAGRDRPNHRRRGQAIQPLLRDSPHVRHSSHGSNYQQYCPDTPMRTSWRSPTFSAPRRLCPRGSDEGKVKSWVRVTLMGVLYSIVANSACRSSAACTTPPAATTTTSRCTWTAASSI